MVEAKIVGEALDLEPADLAGHGHRQQGRVKEDTPLKAPSTERRQQNPIPTRRTKHSLIAARGTTSIGEKHMNQQGKDTGQGHTAARTVDRHRQSSVGIHIGRGQSEAHYRGGKKNHIG